MNVALNAGSEAPETAFRRRRRGVWAWLGVSLLLVLIGLAAAADLMLRRAGPILKGRVIDTLQARFDSEVQLDTLNVSLIHGLEVSGAGLRIFPPDDIRNAGDNKPLIAVRQFSFHAGYRGFFVKPSHIGTVHVSGMILSIPPRQLRGQNAPRPSKARKARIEVVVDLLQIDDSKLVLETLNPDKDPKEFDLRHIELHDFGPHRPFTYDATLINAIPRGDIHAIGSFGPWNVETPSESPLTGNYVFDHADLNPIKGVGGILHSTGSFSGQLNRIDAQGVTDTPDFSLDTADRPEPLHTQFHAVIDGTTGDTYLNSVNATLEHSNFTCDGAIINIRGKGHLIRVNVNVPDGRVEDFLRLAVKAKPLMTGRLQMKAKLNVPPGDESVSKKIQLDSQFALREIYFTDPQMEDKIDDLSLRARGQPKEAKPGAPDVHSTLAGDFVLRSGDMKFSRLVYGMPGGEVRLAGDYHLKSDQFDFTGELRTQAQISQMISSWWKSLLLKPVDRFFRKDGAGAVIPIKISGTRKHPDFALNFGHHDK